MTATEVPDLRVVLADDSAESRVLLRSMLDAVTGIEVVGVASDGRQAVDTVRATGPDAVFLDIAMPVMDGLQSIDEKGQRVHPKGLDIGFRSQAAAARRKPDPSKRVLTCGKGRPTSATVLSADRGGGP